MSSLAQPRRGLYLRPTFRQMQAKFRAEALAQRIAKQVATLIQDKYRGHRFNVTVVAEQRLIIIDHPLLSQLRPPVRYVFYNPDDDKKITNACGEILERLGLERGPNKHPEREFEITYEQVAAAFASKV